MTFCQWFIDSVVTATRRQRSWDTSGSIYSLRHDAGLNFVRNGAFDINGWREKRNFISRDFANLPDIDISLGFDTFLTNVVGQSSQEILSAQKTLTFPP